MSRAFVKEGEDRPDEPIERPISAEPNYVTPSGLAALRASLLAAEKAEDARNVRYYRERVESAVEVDPAGQPRDRVAFGAAVRTLDERGNATQVRIVGEDEADPAHGTISLAFASRSSAAGEESRRPRGRSFAARRASAPYRNHRVLTNRILRVRSVLRGIMLQTEGNAMIPRSGEDREVAALALMLGYFVLFASAGLTIALAARLH